MIQVASRPPLDDARRRGVVGDDRQVALLLPYDFVHPAARGVPTPIKPPIIGSPDIYAGEVPVADVQPKPGATVTGLELVEFAAAHIPERAAVPKRVNITPSLPMTGVGKISKPALQQLEIEAVVRAEALKAGATIAGITHDRDSQGMQLLRVQTGEGTTALRVALDRYAFQSEVLDRSGHPDASTAARSQA